MATAFPATLEQIDARWLTAALRDNGALGAANSVTGFEVLPIGSGFGQTGESVRLRLHHDGDAGRVPQTIFAKFATSDAVRRAASARLGLYRREVDFYRRLAPRTAVRMPGCYFAAVSDDGQSATLLLEDLPDHRPGDDIVGLAAAEATLAIDLLADLHAPFWGEGLSLGVDPLVMGSAAQFETAWYEVERSYGDFLPAQVRAVRDRYIAAIEPLHAWLLTGAVTLGHGDLKLDNIMFGGAGDPIVAVDWQAIRPQRGMRDVAYLISHSMEVGDRRQHERALLKQYVTSLAQRGVDYPPGDIEEDYRLSMLFDFCTALYIAGINLNTNERAIRRKRKLMERCVIALLDWNAFDLLDRFDR